MFKKNLSAIIVLIATLLLDLVLFIKSKICKNEESNKPSKDVNYIGSN